MEWYVNFGSAGVFGGMLLMGLIVGWMDRNAAARISRGDWGSFALWWLPGLSVLQVGGSLVEAVSGGFASLAVALLIGQLRRQHASALPEGGAADAESAPANTTRPTLRPRKARAVRPAVLER
jgi:hypothetical protein